ncbi:hypothetical protein [Nostoc sp. TCL26-01]|nr:hypothetical protein [Nostoc sp. TCL26-01]
MSNAPLGTMFSKLAEVEMNGKVLYKIYLKIIYPNQRSPLN